MSFRHLSRRRRVGATLALALVLAGLTLPAATSVGAASATVTFGGIHAFATSTDPSILGRASMVRTASGRTIVTIEVRRLEPDAAYHAHVHVRACGDNAAGGHYRFDPAGPSAPPNEIWPEFTTNAAGAGVGRATVEAVAGPSAVAVVVHAPGGAKIACADLG